MPNMYRAKPTRSVHVHGGEAVKGFKEFVLRGNVVDLAVALVVGVAFTDVVKAFVRDFLTPLIASIGGQPDFSALYFTINKSKFMYGDFINFVISFLLVAAVIYFIVVLPMTKYQEQRTRQLGEHPKDSQLSEKDVLLEIRDLLQQGQERERTKF
jgi:large conductance mechanosensitive channel